MTARDEEMFDELSPPYSTIVADPPWRYDEGTAGWIGKGGYARALPYGQMDLGEIRSLPVSELAAPAAYLYCWTTQRHLEAAFGIVRAWGWSPLKTLTWCKEPMGIRHGGTFANTTEFVIYARRPVGEFIRIARERHGVSYAAVRQHIRGTGLSALWERNERYPNQEDWARLRELLPSLPESVTPSATASVETTWWKWKRGAHSAKPAAFMDIVEQVSPGPYVELFARAPRLGWDSWGHGYEIGTEAS